MSACRGEVLVLVTYKGYKEGRSPQFSVPKNKHVLGGGRGSPLPSQFGGVTLGHHEEGRLPEVDRYELGTIGRPSGDGK